MSDIIRSERLAGMGVENMVFEEITETHQISQLVLAQNRNKEQFDSLPDGDESQSGRGEQHEPSDIQDVVDESMPSESAASMGLAEIKADLQRMIEAIQTNEARIQEAYERGLEEGVRRATEAQSELAEQYVYGLERLEMLGRTLDVLARHETLEIALLISKRILQKEITTEPMLLIELVKRVAAETMGRKELTIRLHPEDLVVIRAQAPNLSDHFPAVAEITLAEDPSLERGDCIVDTEVEQINLSLEEQLSAIKRAIEEEIQ